MVAQSTEGQPADRLTVPWGLGYCIEGKVVHERSWRVCDSRQVLSVARRVQVSEGGGATVADIVADSTTVPSRIANGRGN